MCISVNYFRLVLAERSSSSIRS